MKTPILFLVFNRPELTSKVFEEIRKAKPEKLFIAADGPRENMEGEIEKCRKTRKIIEQIDWKCDIKTLFRDVNLGCKVAVSSAITWFFDNVEEGIILEDDCLPDQSFFTFCEALLEKYRDEEKIMHIGGTNFQEGKKIGNSSYYFSHYPHIWGWATWKRAWKHYNLEMTGFNDFKKINKIVSLFKLKDIADFHLAKLQKTFDGEIDTWDYQWHYSIWNQEGISIIPNINLVSNIGFDEFATHTKTSSSPYSNIKSFSLSQIQYIDKIKVNYMADIFFTIKMMGYWSLADYLISKMKNKTLQSVRFFLNFLPDKSIKTLKSWRDSFIIKRGNDKV